MCIFDTADQTSLGALTDLPSGDGGSCASASCCSFPPSRLQYHAEAQPRRVVCKDRDTMASRCARRTTTMAIAGLGRRFRGCPAQRYVEGSGRRRSQVRPTGGGGAGSRRQSGLGDPGDTKWRAGGIRRRTRAAREEVVSSGAWGRGAGLQEQAATGEATSAR